MMPASMLFHGKPSRSSSVFEQHRVLVADVRCAIVWMRQCATSSPSRNTPSTVLVFPTSTARSVVIRS